MNRLFVIPLIGAVLLLAGCQTPKQYMARHGEPDLISDETREFYRMYLPGDDVEKWHNAITTLYYLDENLQVRFKQGQVKKQSIPDEEVESLLVTQQLLNAVDNGDEVSW